MKIPKRQAWLGALATALALAAIPALLTGAEKNAPAAGIQLPTGAERAAKAIDRSSLQAPIRFLADDLLEGRGPASRGDETAQLYLASTLEFLGYQPVLPGGEWQQRFQIVGIKSDMPKTWEFKAGGQTVPLKWWDDYIGASGVQGPASTIQDAELVFVGYGIQAPEYQWDDFKGVDLKGKVLVMMNNDPDSDPKLFEGNRRLYYGRWTYKYESAARQGAAGAIIIHTTPSAGYPWQVVQTSWSGEQFELPAAGEPRVQLRGWATEDAARKLLQAAGKDLAKLIEQARSRDFKPVPLGITTSLTFSNRINKSNTTNVLGLLPGSDPNLKDEVVVYTAHHDHLGVGQPDKRGDKIYNGAVDNASGCAEVLAIAKAFATLPQRPRRSILIAFVAAEEQGLLGSQYLATHPPVPAGRIAANLNFDGGNVLGRTRDVTQIGLGKSSLDMIVRAIAARQGRKLVGDQFPDRGFFYRSDQFSFAKVGVPAIHPEGGTDYIGKPAGWGKEQANEYEQHRYHQPSDEFDPKWNYDGMIEDAQLGFYTGLVVATNSQMPTWNPGDEFEAARKKSLAEVNRKGK
ncbi:MAG TPA: M28 family metallopeptidase [Thermoanaerobaculia bacterium]|jgi:Zn-dependent M28 family amino/carboxypeptidase|nr:M28 family metallopeptidase [Thermoanaerobaculia bacterium]